ncbi:hypothetical protein KY329_01725 [Candidatus Woesearchaeota archaeon]|nr:hypothetical protein [Candidatus Woesearchaeota archaeon]
MRQILGLSIVAGFAILFIVTIVMLTPNITGQYTQSGTYLQYTPAEACMTLPVPCQFNKFVTSIATAAPFNMPMVECTCTDGTLRYALTTRPVVGLANS